ncbi:hypothetical protein BH24ACT26_BH24ACT26_03200 [soil metagenome]
MRDGLRHRGTVPLVLAVCAALVGASLFLRSDREGSESAARQLGREARTFPSNDPLERACALPDEWLQRIWRGHDPARSEDLTLVPSQPNYSGTFDIVSHSGPWDYLQRIPLVLYGPGWISRSPGPVSRPVTLADVYPTIGSLLDFRLPSRAGRALGEAVAPRTKDIPKLIVTVVWDGVGRNTLARWPGRWPHLERLVSRGTSYANATVGSSPSITPASHSTLGTGTWPRTHRVTAIEMRQSNGRVGTTFKGKDLSALARTTFADNIDRALGNEPKVGLLGWNPWHIGMMGHGAGTPDGDTDQVGIIDYQHPGRVTGNADLYSTPEYLDGFPGLEDHAERLDVGDGRADDEWMGDDILARDDNPAWVRWQSDMLLAMLEREGYGSDDVPDLFFVNFYPSDAAGHYSTIDSGKTAEVLQAQDDALGQMVEYLDEEVEDYVLLLTADHGHSPSPRTTGAWPITQGRLATDIDAHFDIPEGSSLVQETAAFGFFLNLPLMDRSEITVADVAEFVNAYTIRDNWGPDELPEGYQNRGDEPVFEAAFPSAELPDIMDCASK